MGQATRAEAGIVAQVARTVATVVRATRASVQSVVIGPRVIRARAPSVVIEARAIRVRAPSVAIRAQATRALVRTAVTVERPTRASLQIMATGVQVRQTMLKTTRRAWARRTAVTDARTEAEIAEESARGLPLGSREVRRPALNSRPTVSKSDIRTV